MRATRVIAQPSRFRAAGWECVCTLATAQVGGGRVCTLVMVLPVISGRACGHQLGVPCLVRAGAVRVCTLVMVEAIADQVSDNVGLIRFDMLACRWQS